jgi:serine/threonine protein kinase
MPRTRKGRKGQRGKGLIGEGSFGCVLRPSLPCGNSPNVNAEPFKTTTSNNYVTKYLDQSEAIEEKKQSQILRSVIADIDPDEIFVSPRAICSVPALDASQQAELAKCKAKVTSPYLVQLAYGGQNLSDFVCPKEDYNVFFGSLLDLMNALQKLHDANICHLDIKPQNIVTQKQPDGSYLTRFVDIGYMMDTTKYAEYTKKPQLGVDYSIWPFETRLLSVGFVGVPNYFTINTFYDKIVYNLPKYSIPNKYYYYANYSPVHFNNQFLNKQLRSCQNPDKSLNVAALAKTTDVYSLGWTLSMIYSNTFKHKYSNNAIEYLINDPFNIALADRCTRIMYEIVCKMTWPDMDERFKLPDAIAKYTEFVTELNAVLGEFPI